MTDNSSFTYEYSASGVDVLSPVKPIVLATVMAMTPPASIIASQTEYFCYDQIVCQESIGPCVNVRDSVAAFCQADVDRCDILNIISSLGGQMGERDYYVARKFVQNLPRDLFVESLGVDTDGYLTIGWELARFRGISVSFSGERVHVVGRHRAKKIAKSVHPDSMEDIYKQIRTVLYE